MAARPPPERENRMRIAVAHLYPDYLNIYADRGNMLFLRRRCEWRGIEYEQASAGPGESFLRAELVVAAAPRVVTNHVYRNRPAEHVLL